MRNGRRNGIQHLSAANEMLRPERFCECSSLVYILKNCVRSHDNEIPRRKQRSSCENRPRHPNSVFLTDNNSKLAVTVEMINIHNRINFVHFHLVKPRNYGYSQKFHFSCRVNKHMSVAYFSLCTVSFSACLCLAISLSSFLFLLVKL